MSFRSGTVGDVTFLPNKRKRHPVADDQKNRGERMLKLLAFLAQTRIHKG